MSPCNTFNGPGGTKIIACGGRAPRRRCSICHELGADKLCDFPVEGSNPTVARTCDKPLCNKCAVHREPNQDYCPGHVVTEPQEQGAST